MRSGIFIAIRRSNNVPEAPNPDSYPNPDRDAYRDGDADSSTGDDHARGR